MLKKLLSKIKEVFKSGFCIRRVVRSFDEHFNISKSFTIYGRNAMHWAVNIKIFGAWLCFRLPFTCFGKWWPLYLYYSIDGTPNMAKWKIGKC